MSSDPIMNGMLLEDRRPVFVNSKHTQSYLDPITKASNGGAELEVQGPKTTGIVDVVLGMDQDGFKKLFIDLVSSLP